MSCRCWPLHAVYMPLLVFVQSGFQLLNFFCNSHSKRIQFHCKKNKRNFSHMFSSQHRRLKVYEGGETPIELEKFLILGSLIFVFHLQSEFHPTNIVRFNVGVPSTCHALCAMARIHSNAISCPQISLPHRSVSHGPQLWLAAENDSGSAILTDCVACVLLAHNVLGVLYSYLRASCIDQAKLVGASNSACHRQMITGRREFGEEATQLSCIGLA